MKNQEKTQEEIQMKNVPQQKNNKIYKGNIYSNILYVNTTLVKFHHNLSMKYFNWTLDHKTAKNLISRKE